MRVDRQSPARRGGVEGLCRGKNVAASVLRGVPTDEGIACTHGRLRRERVYVSRGPDNCFRRRITSASAVIVKRNGPGVHTPLRVHRYICIYNRFGAEIHRPSGRRTPPRKAVALARRCGHRQRARGLPEGHSMHHRIAAVIHAAAVRVTGNNIRVRAVRDRVCAA